MKINYSLLISDAFGNRLLTNPYFFSGEYVRGENTIGSLTVRFPGNISSEFFKWHGRIEIWRSIDGAPATLVENTVWLINKITRQISGKERIWEIEAACANSILATRIVDYNQGNSYTLKLAAADDLGKAVVRENLGSLVTDSTRDISSYLTVEANTTLGPTVKLAFENQNVFDVLSDLAEASAQLGTYLVFDVTYEGNLFVFRSYTNYRGNDHRFPSGSAGPILIGPEFGNFIGASVSTDYSSAWSRGIVSGESVAGVYAKARVNNTDLQSQSPFGLVESYETTQNQVADSTLLTSEANALVRRGTAKIKIAGSVANTPNFVYGLHWGWGDFLTVQIDGFSYDVHIDKVSVPIGIEVLQDQNIDVIMRTE